MGLRSGLDIVTKRELLSCRESKSGPPARSSITTLNIAYAQFISGFWMMDLLPIFLKGTPIFHIVSEFHYKLSAQPSFLYVREAYLDPAS